MLIHTDYDTVGLKGMRRQNQHAVPADGAGDVRAAERASSGAVPGAEEDPELAAYNARLAQLAAKGPKTWRSRDDGRRPTGAVRRLTERGLRGRSSATS